MVGGGALLNKILKTRPQIEGLECLLGKATVHEMGPQNVFSNSIDNLKILIIVIRISLQIRKMQILVVERIQMYPGIAVIWYMVRHEFPRNF